MIKISIFRGFSKSDDINLDSSSVSMISCFLQYMSFADYFHYNSSDRIMECVSEFYDSNFHSSLIQDSKLLKSFLDYAFNNHV